MSFKSKMTAFAVSASLLSCPAFAADYENGVRLGLEPTRAQEQFEAEQKRIARGHYQQIETYEVTGTRRRVNGYSAQPQLCDRECRRAKVGVAIIGGIAAGLGGALGRGVANKLF